MVRYYFDIDDDGALDRDEEGMELPSLQDAKAEALHALQDFARDALPRRDRRRYTISVRQFGDDAHLYECTVEITARERQKRPTTGTSTERHVGH